MSTSAASCPPAVRHRAASGSCRWLILLVLLLVIPASAARAASPVAEWSDAVDNQLLDYYQDPAAHAQDKPLAPDSAAAHWSAAARQILDAPAPAGPAPLPLAAGRLKARMQHALTFEMALAVRAGRIEDAKALRAELMLPRGVSAAEGALLLQAITPANRDQTARLLVREAITWQTTRVRTLFDTAARDAARPEIPLPGRLLEHLGEALVLADLPPAIKTEAGLTDVTPLPAGDIAALLSTIEKSSWSTVAQPVAQLRLLVEARLPSLLTKAERNRRERMLLKLVELVPKEYANGVRGGAVRVPMEYREAVSFTQEAQQIVGELAPIWLSAGSSVTPADVKTLEGYLAAAAKQIDDKVDPSALNPTLAGASDLLRNKFNISLRLTGTTGDIVDEVMLETRRLLGESLAAAIDGRWDEAKRLRVEAYTTFDPDLESRLVPRDPQLALDIEHLLLDGLDEPGVKVLLDNHASPTELNAGYQRVNDALTRAAALLKTDISPTAAVTSATSIVVREGLEGLLVIIAILAGLRGEDNKGRRQLFWGGIVLSLVATAGTWILSQTLMTSLRNYGEIIAAVTGILAIGVLLLITNWLFHQVYWRQWVTTLKSTAQGEKAWQLLTVGFLVGYREGFETVLFLQSLFLDAGGKPVAIGVAIGLVILLILGVAALKVGLKLPYFHILMATALLIGFVLVTFVGGTVRAAQTVGWMPVHRLTHGSWPAWMGNWFGLHNTRESIACQVLICLIVLGTWRIARWQAKRKHARRIPLNQAPAAPAHECSPFTCEDRPGCPFVPTPAEKPVPALPSTTPMA